jgi:hypothetical protein
MTNWLVTTPDDDEGSFETDDEGVMFLAARIIRAADLIPDGSYYMIRKADYLNTKPVWSGTVTGRMTHDKPFMEEVPRLTLIKGGIIS